MDTDGRGNPQGAVAQADADSMDEQGVDPRAPRFGQALTATLLLAGVALQAPAFVYAVAAVLAAAVLTGWRVDLWAVCFRRVVRPRIGPPTRLEDPSPHRFAKLLGAVGTVLASGFAIAGLAVAAYAIATAVAIAAGLAAVTGLCIGCRLYRQVRFVQRLGIV